jgi:hypothetical protein
MCRRGCEVIGRADARHAAAIGGSTTPQVSVQLGWSYPS